MGRELKEWLRRWKREMEEDAEVAAMSVGGIVCVVAMIAEWVRKCVSG